MAITSSISRKFRDPVSALTHLISAGVALLGILVLLVLGWGNLLRLLSLVVYGIGLVGLFLASGIYHSYIGDPDHLLRLRRWDHSAIYILIAATYTPICVNVLHGFWQWGLLITIWAMAAIGIAVKLFYIDSPRWLTAGVYVIMGWFIIFGAKEMLAVLSWPVLIWLIIGGLFYTVGAAIYTTKKMDFIPGIFGFHEVWHIFVMLGAFSHFIFIYLAVIR